MHPWVEAADGRTMVLLGAGASVPAGLPSSAALIDALKEVEGTPELRSMLDFIESRISQDGRNPNIEQVYAAAFDYFHREEAPVSMFVERWATPPSTHESQMSGILDAEFMASFIPFTILSKIDELSVEASKRTDYLLPLLASSVASIVTLNYDLLVEVAAQQLGKRLTDGADEWEGSYEWPKVSAQPELIKLHGSLDWRASINYELPGNSLTMSCQRLERGATTLGGPGTTANMGHAVIFGAGNKLTSSFVFPALMNRFRESLGASRTLVIVGYSFSDAHVNEAIHRWLGMNAEARIVVLDVRELDDPSLAIFGEISGRLPLEGLEFMLPEWRRETEKRIEYVRGDAKFTISRVLGPAPQCQE